MWEKINKFVRTQTVIAVFLLSVLFISAVAVLGISILDLTPPIRLAIFTAGQLVLSGVVIWLMRKLGVFDADDFRFKGIGKGLLLGWFGFVYIAITFFVNFMPAQENGFIVSNTFYLLLVILHPLIGTGLFEEVLYRGLVLKILLKKTGGTKKGIMFACVVSSMLFGLLHIPNLITGAPVLQTVSQIISAATIGLFFAAIYLRTKRLWIPILFHGFLNLSAQIFNAIVASDTVAQGVETQTGTDIVGFILMTLFEALPPLIAGLVLLRKVKSDDISDEKTDAPSVDEVD